MFKSFYSDFYSLLFAKLRGSFNLQIQSYVCDVFNVTNVGEIDVPKIGKVSETFYNQCITL